MNKTAIKNFAIWARNKLIADISYRAGLMGITADGIHSALPQSTGQTEFYDIGTAEPYAIIGEAIRQRKHLVERIREKEKDTDYKTAYKYIIEEVAYTWFNRLIAVRFMEVNDYLPSHIRVLSSDTGKLEPDLVTTPFDAELEFSRDEQQAVLDLKNANKLDEVFRMLFIKQCNALNEILPALFEKTNDYTELLLNLSVVDQDGVVYHLVHDIPEEDFDVERGGQVEIIGWLYQYYNTEPKDNTFDLLKKNVKVTKETLPFVTQLFTPDWIVRYMVENSLGRLWIEGHPNEDLKAEWQYFLDEAEQSSEVQMQLSDIRKEYAQLNPEDIKVIDPCMGSGHILVYAFDVLMQIYVSAGYGQRDATRCILENNLYGFDIDDRAFQMAYFAVMMKARQYNRRVLNGAYKPNVFSVQESNGIDRNQLKYFGANLDGLEKNIALTQMLSLLDTFKDAKEYGSTLKVEKYDWNLLYRFISSVETIGQLSFDTVDIDDTKEKLYQIIKQGLLLSQEYHITVTNPPYMGASNMDLTLSNYLKREYPTTKSDMSTVFMQRSIDMVHGHGFVAMINIPVWMFLSSFERFRKYLVTEYTINSMLHLGRGIFGSDFGTTAFIIRKTCCPDFVGTYKRLYEKQGAVDSVEEKRVKFFNGAGVFNAKQKLYEKIPGTPIAYWASKNIIAAFENNPLLNDIAEVKIGMGTGKNDLFVREWWEPLGEDIDFSIKDISELNDSNGKYFPYNKGGDFRLWYGNLNEVLWFDENGRKTMAGMSGHRENGGHDYYFKKGITWSFISASKFGVRSRPSGSLFDVAGSMLFVDESIYYYVLAFLCSSTCNHILNMLNPTLNYQAGNIKSLPLIDKSDLKVADIARSNVLLSKKDWDSFETSWDFKRHPLV